MALVTLTDPSPASLANTRFGTFTLVRKFTLDAFGTLAVSCTVTKPPLSPLVAVTLRTTPVAPVGTTVPTPGNAPVIFTLRVWPWPILLEPRVSNTRVGSVAVRKPVPPGDQ